ncbi:hypothetical protein ES702_02751 [subsurface metagenome]
MIEHQKHLTGFDDELTKFVIGFHQMKKSIKTNKKGDTLEQKQLWE